MNGFTGWWFGEEKGASMPVPMVYVKDQPHFEFKQIVRDLDSESAPTEDELNALGGEGWQIAGIATVSSRLYIYLQRLA